MSCSITNRNVALLGQGAVLVINGGEEALHAGVQVHRVDRGGVAGEIEVARHRLLDHRGDGHRRRRGRDIFILLAAAGEGKRHKSRPHQTPPSGRAPHAHDQSQPVPNRSLPSPDAKFRRIVRTGPNPVHDCPPGRWKALAGGNVPFRWLTGRPGRRHDATEASGATGKCRFGISPPSSH